MQVNDNYETLVSCIIPTYKRSESLIRAIKSVLNQTYRNIEIIIVDDNDPNDEYSIELQKKISIFKDDRLIYLQQEKHTNGAVARNYGVFHSNGNYIAFLDDDDEWLPEKIAIQMEILENLEVEYGAVSCLSNFMKNEQIIKTTNKFTEDNLQKKVLERTVEFNTSTVLFRKENLVKVGVFNEKLERHQDLQLFVVFLNNYKIKPLDKALVNYHLDDALNRPDTERLIKIKKDYFIEINHIMENYTLREKNTILAAHYFEIIYSALKEKKIKLSLKFLFQIGINFVAYRNLFNRMLTRR